MKNDLKKKNIKNFFKQRAKTYNKFNPLKTVIYQDKNPSLAKKRDKFEKKKIKKIIKLNENDVVLDIGCGIGRWAEKISKRVKKYVGIDYSEDFIKIAKKKYFKEKNINFICLEGPNLLDAKVKAHSPYTVILIMGLFPYINEKESYNIIKKIKKINSKNCKIIIREPIAIDKEFVLDNVWSDDMETSYSAKYRTYKWFKRMFISTQLSKFYKIIIDEPLYPNHLNNRKETRQHLFYLKKKNS